MTTTPTKNESLPELPEASVSVNENGVVMAGLPTPAMVPHWANTTPYYTKDQMLAYGRACVAITREAPTEGVPVGWRLVPIEPTWDMRNEGREFLIDGLEKEPEKLAYFLWKTMVAAAPEVK